MKVRCFTAINFSSAVVDSIDAFICELADSISPQTAQIKWERKQNIHLTLNFLGEIEETLLQEIIRETRARILPAATPIQIVVSGLGAFPAMRRPRILWLGCEDESKRVQDIQTQIQSIAIDVSKGAIRFEERDYTPHITIGRVRTLQQPYMLEKSLKDFQGQGITLYDQVKNISFMKSTLGSSGSVYSIINDLPVINP